MENSEAEGVYGSLGFHYYSDDTKKKYDDLGYSKPTTISAKANPNELFMVLSGRHPSISGHLHLNAVTVRRSVFNGKTDKFSNLRLHQDAIFLIQLSINCQLIAGSIYEPVAMRGVHENNRITSTNKNSLLLMWQELYNWSKKTSQGSSVSSAFKLPLLKQKILCAGRIKGFFLLTWYSLTNQQFADHKYFFNPCSIYVFRKYYGVYVIIAKERIVKFLFNRVSSCNKAELDILQALHHNAG